MIMHCLSVHTRPLCLRLILLLIIMLASAVSALAGQLMSAGRSTAPVWSFVISTAPGLPQDVWVTGRGNNQDGWISAGVLCLGPLAQGFGPTQHATLDADVSQAGTSGSMGPRCPRVHIRFPGAWS